MLNRRESRFDFWTGDDCSVCAEFRDDRLIQAWIVYPPHPGDTPGLYVRADRLR
jgi:hypothetical protein